MIPPLSFIPKLHPKIWGGRRLEGWGRALPDGEAIGESWEIYDRPQDSAAVAAGAFRGTQLSELLARYGEELLGSRIFRRGAARFPLMLKLIDASESLSVQVHPDDAQAARLEGSGACGKTEMWVVLEASPGARVTAGFRPGVGRQEFLAALEAGRLEAVLNEFEVQTGDYIFIPAGRVHAIGKGCLMAEVQQNSDITYRVYDYGRLENGKPRPLHLRQALECIRFEPSAPPSRQAPALRRVEGGICETLVRCDYFEVERLRLEGRFAPDRGEGAFHLLLGLAGQARLEHPQGSEILSRGAVRLVPAGLSWSLAASQPAEVLWTRPV